MPFDYKQLPCPIILKLRLFLIFPTHPEIKLSALEYPFFGMGGFAPLKFPHKINNFKTLFVNY